MDLLKYFGIRETYQLPEALMKCVLDKEALRGIMQAYKTEHQDLSIDVFRDKFQDEHADRTAFMQDFTPDCIGEILTGLCAEGIQSAADICAGTGGLAIKIWNKNPRASFTCFELSERVLPILLFNLAVRNMEAAVWHGDVLTREFTRIYRVHDSEITVSDPREAAAPECDVVVSNPPYSQHWEPSEEKASDPRYANYGMAPKSKADYAFLLHDLYHLKPTGIMTIVLPHGVLFRGGAEETIRRYMIEKLNVIDAIIGLPANLFYGTGIPVCIIVCKKNRNGKRRGI